MKKGGKVGRDKKANDPNDPPLTNDEAEKKKISKDAEMDRNMDKGLKKHKARKMAKGGKVRGCGIAKRGLGRGTRSR